jgi:ribosomal peptide maturation radical SAM protein 1
MSGVLFAAMPFGGLDRPQLGVSLLKAELRSRGIPSAVAYFNFAFAEATGYQAYQNMSTGQTYDGDTLAGEWMFARSLFPHSSRDDDAYLDYIVSRYSCSAASINDIRRAANLVEPFLDHCLRSVDWDRYSIIGFTSTFEQNLACLALAKRIKERFPDKIIIMGGANCADVMGVQLHKSFPFLDYVFTGEADLGFPELISRLANGNGHCDDIPGQVRREGGKSVAIPDVPVHEMDALSYPDFDDYFAAYRTTPLRHNFTPLLQMETARGCWWGAKHHCTFCGLNANGMAFRAKSPERAMDELLHLVSRYGVNHVAPTDNIISMDYFRTFLPELKRRNTGIKLFYETKANLNEEQVQLLAGAGVTCVTPGIESLSANVLALMRKGVSPLQNVQLLKWCRQYGVHPFWNLLYGFPGETAADYEEVCCIAENLSHLTPPINFIPVALERFSPYFHSAADFGIRNVRSHSSYRHIYPFDESALYNIAYFFDFEFDGKEKLEGWSAEVRALVKHWNNVHAQSLLEVVARTEDTMVVRDTRPNRVHPFYRFGTREASVIDACDRTQTLPQITQHLRQTLNGSMPPESWIGGFMRYLADCRLVLQRDGRYLSLIVSQPKEAARPVGRGGALTLTLPSSRERDRE